MNAFPILRCRRCAYDPVDDGVVVRLLFLVETTHVALPTIGIGSPAYEIEAWFERCVATEACVAGARDQIRGLMRVMTCSAFRRLFRSLGKAAALAEVVSMVAAPFIEMVGPSVDDQVFEKCRVLFGL